MEPATASETIRRVAQAWGPAHPRPEALEHGDLPSLLRLDPSTGEEAREHLSEILSEVGVALEGLVEGRAQLDWPSEARCKRRPPLLVITARHVVLFERERPDEAWLALHGLARARELSPVAVWLGGSPVPEGWRPMHIKRLLERVT